jgi:hypothetical protein
VSGNRPIPALSQDPIVAHDDCTNGHLSLALGAQGEPERVLHPLLVAAHADRPMVSPSARVKLVAGTFMNGS